MTKGKKKIHTFRLYWGGKGGGITDPLKTPAEARYYMGGRGTCALKRMTAVMYLSRQDL